MDSRVQRVQGGASSDCTHARKPASPKTTSADWKDQQEVVNSLHAAVVLVPIPLMAPQYHLVVAWLTAPV